MLVDKRVRVGAAQTFPEWFDLEGTVQKVEAWIEKASLESIDLLVFPECFLGGYPYWRGSETMSESIEYLSLLQENAVERNSSEIFRLCRAAEKHKVNCVIGANELDREGGAFTLYNSQLIISKAGELLAIRRKLMPTHSERTYWGRGGTADIVAFDLDVGRKHLRKRRKGPIDLQSGDLPVPRGRVLASGARQQCAPSPRRL